MKPDPQKKMRTTLLVLLIALLACTFTMTEARRSPSYNGPRDFSLTQEKYRSKYHEDIVYDTFRIRGKTSYRSTASTFFSIGSMLALGFVVIAGVSGGCILRNKNVLFRNKMDAMELPM
jgi:uncharacterized membrane protein